MNPHPSSRLLRFLRLKWRSSYAAIIGITTSQIENHVCFSALLNFLTCLTQVGIATGVANSALIHPFNAVKYRFSLPPYQPSLASLLCHSSCSSFSCSMWGKDDATTVGTMRHMWRMGGLKPFFAAYRVTAVREGLPHPPFTLPRIAYHRSCSLHFHAHPVSSSADVPASGFWQHLRELAHAPPVRSSALSSTSFKPIILRCVTSCAAGRCILETQAQPSAAVPPS
jgi:hypothetical protein